MCACVGVRQSVCMCATVCVCARGCACDSLCACVCVHVGVRATVCVSLPGSEAVDVDSRLGLLPQADR